LLIPLPATIISQVTEWSSLGDLQVAKDALIESKEQHPCCQKIRPALLRKDFIINTRMIDEAIAAGADTVLLIVAILTKPLLKILINHCRTFLTKRKSQLNHSGKFTRYRLNWMWLWNVVRKLSV